MVPGPQKCYGVDNYEVLKGLGAQALLDMNAKLRQLNVGCFWMEDAIREGGPQIPVTWFFVETASADFFMATNKSRLRL